MVPFIQNSRTEKLICPKKKKNQKSGVGSRGWLAKAHKGTFWVMGSGLGYTGAYIYQDHQIAQT